jgi:hypothetical protein
MPTFLASERPIYVASAGSKVFRSTASNNASAKTALRSFQQNQQQSSATPAGKGWAKYFRNIPTSFTTDAASRKQFENEFRFYEPCALGSCSEQLFNLLRRKGAPVNGIKPLILL